jgi:hypothetical protein
MTPLTGKSILEKHNVKAFGENGANVLAAMKEVAEISFQAGAFSGNAMSQVLAKEKALTKDQFLASLFPNKEEHD